MPWPAWSRHPNYFGEWLFWVGLWLAGGAESLLIGWSTLGPLTMTALFLGISIGLMEKRQADRKGYVCRVRLTSVDEWRKGRCLVTFEVACYVWCICDSLAWQAYVKQVPSSFVPLPPALARQVCGFVHPRNDSNK